MLGTRGDAPGGEITLDVAKRTHVGYSNTGLAIAFRSNRNRKVQSIESRSKSHAIAMLIRSVIPIDRKFPANYAITDSVVSA